MTLLFLDRNRPSESSHHEQEPQAGNGKVRKISSDEERLFELRTELTEKAARQEEHTEISAEEVDSNDTESLSNDSDSAHSQESEIKFRAPNMNLGVTSDRTEYRLSEIEKKLEKIEARLDKNENNKNSDDISRHMVYEDLVAKEIKLEKENQSLKDENYCLKLKILELNKIIENQQKKLNFDISSAQAQILNPQCAPHSTSQYPKGVRWLEISKVGCKIQTTTHTNILCYTESFQCVGN